MTKETLRFPEPARFTTEIPVRITDLNYGNHLGHDTLVSILHESRAQLFRHHGMTEGDIDGLGILLVDLAVRYQGQVFYGETLTVEIAPGEIGSRGCDLFYRVTSGEKKVGLARTGIVFFDYAAERVAKTPDRFRRALGS